LFHPTILDSRLRGNDRGYEITTPHEMRLVMTEKGHAMTSLFQYHQRISLHLSCPPPAGD